MTALGFIVLAPLALALFAVVSLAGTAIGLAAAVRSLTRPLRSPGRDPARRTYVAGPVLLDVWHFGRTALRGAYRRLVALPDPATADSLFTRVWRRQSIRDHTGPLILPYAATAGGYALGFFTSALLIVTAAAAHALFAALLVLAVRTTAFALRRFEITTQALRGITTECGNCHQLLPRPAFVCSCGRTHHHLMPGDQGVFRRTCLCGHRLPTLLLNGKRALPATCAHCRAPLPAFAQSLPTVHIPIVGGKGSGKSAFTTAALSRPLGDRHLFHLHEVCEHAEHLMDASFLGLAKGMILIVDPHGADPKPVLDRVIDTLAELHGTTFPLAVVISKADLLPAGPTSARQWLHDNGRIDLLNTADTHFTQVRCFVFPHDDPATPVLWLVGR